ncbi:macro domain-containing protein [Streptomyces sp. NBC_00223]|uniref:macro domain-containing protein n=1 Tax=Streptomyces sp. NBC_00223 TaxID=2976008 RepID=UPI002E2A8A97|nr:macro domain-containing protein [Streptomyces sp. NBC_00223]
MAHGCNCAGAMGRGIAVEFKHRWPSMYTEYQHRCRTGLFTPGEVFPWRAPDGTTIYNLGTQAHWRTPARLDDVRTAFHAMIAQANTHGIRLIAMPRIAAGLGRLAWQDIERSLNEVLQANSTAGTTEDTAANPLTVAVYTQAHT